MKESFVIKSKVKDILADVTFNDHNNKKPIIIFCHGYKGYKDWGAWNQVADLFADQGFFFLKFNFSYNGGTIDNPIDFPDLEAFGNNTYSKEVEDLNSVINWLVEDNTYSKHIDKDNVNIIGHSRAGGIVSLVGARNINVSSIISWAGVSDYENRFPKGELLDKWKNDGVYYVVNGRTKQQMPHYFCFYKDFEQNKKELNILKAVTEIEIPHLILHGENDEAVSVSEAESLKKANPKAILEIIPKAGHTFGAKHPWTHKKLPNDLLEVVKKTVEFINN